MNQNYEEKNALAQLKRKTARDFYIPINPSKY